MVQRLAGHAVAKNYKKKAKDICPECGKDIHDADCAYSEKGR